MRKLIEIITSPSNARLKTVRRLQTERKARIQEQQFVTEGKRWLKTIVTHGYPVDFTFTTDEADVDALLEQIDAPHFRLSAELMRSISSMETPPGVLCLLPRPALQPPATASLTLILDNIREPGNLGTIIRTAAAVGVDEVVLSPGCVDFTNPKVVRAAAGTLFQVVITEKGWDDVRSLCASRAVYATKHGAGQRYDQVDWSEPVALIISNEANGISDEAAAITAQAVSIPMREGVDSLNAAMATAIVLYEIARSRGFPAS